MREARSSYRVYRIEMKMGDLTLRWILERLILRMEVVQYNLQFLFFY
jgi:hypothetical protein